MAWQQELAQNAREVEHLLKFVPLTADEQKQMAEILERFPMSVTPYYLSLIDINDPSDPIRKMAIPSISETDMSGSFDTSGEAGNTVVEGLQHKYAETAMMLSTNQCAMYCRHCFRKRLVGLSDDEIAKHFETMAEYIRSHKEISNVLVSGGDALLNSNERLKTILDLLVNIDHLDNIRIATRVPVVFPSRITTDQELLDLLGEYSAKKQLYLVTQYNHPRELTDESVAAVRAIQKLDIPVKNQAVLLKGVNDALETLGGLLRGLVRIGVTPYYVFQCRPVSGVKNQFQLPLREGLEIVEKAKAMQNGCGKCFKYCMSHVTGKLEILGAMEDGKMLFKYHEACDKGNLGRVFAKDVQPQQAWLGDQEAL